MADNIPENLFRVLGNTNIKKQFLVTVKNVIPTINQEDIERRVKTRYFTKLTTQRNGTIYELDGGQYSLIQNNSLYRKTTIDWIIRGKLEDTILTLPAGDNILIKGVISQNKELLGIAEAELPGITNHIRNYMEFWSGE